jgi:hypothetical protein
MCVRCLVNKSEKFLRLWRFTNNFNDITKNDLTEIERNVFTF